MDSSHSFGYFVDKNKKLTKLHLTILIAMIIVSLALIVVVQKYFTDYLWTFVSGGIRSSSSHFHERLLKLDTMIRQKQHINMNNLILNIICFILTLLLTIALKKIVTGLISWFTEKIPAVRTEAS